MVSAKGKEKVADSGGKGKRKWSGGGGDDDKTGRKRKNRGVLQFFEDAAYQVDEDEDSSDDSLFDDLEDEFFPELNLNNESGKVPPLPFIPKEEELSEEELERMFEERYKPGSGFVTYAEDGYEHKKSVDRDIYVPSAKDPTIWKVKCMIGRERYSALCLMQKYVDLDYLGTKLQIISACALDHVKGFIFVEAEKQNDIYEACKGLSSIYSSRVTAVPNNEISRLLLVRSKSSGISEGMWARVKNGKYKGDLGQVVAVNDVRKKVTVKLVPRIDLKAMAEKFGGGVPAKRTAVPAQRLISSSELEEFRPLIQFRRDRDTNQMFEILDGMMLKDGYLYKKISIDSLSFWGIMPTEDELLKFEPSKKDESTDVQWLSQLFGEKKKKEVESIKPDKGGGKSEGSSSACMGKIFEVHDLVFFGRKDFGVAIGSEKDDTVKIMKEGSEGPLVVTVKQSEVKNASFDKKLFSVLDRHSNTLTVNDNVRVLDGPLKDRQGIIKKIYKGILFLCDESELENDGYICVKAQLCEKVNLSGDASNEKDTEPVPSGFADLMSSPKSPLSPDKSLQERDNKTNFKRDDNAIFSVGQTLRIRVGPLKGYICRVLAVRRSDVTVKLDSQHKILTVKSEHLSEVRGRNSAIAQGEESVKPFDFLGTQDGARDWMDGAALSTEDDKWNAGGSTERSSWSAVPSSNSSLWNGSGSSDPADNDANKGAKDSSWQLKETPTENSSWGAAAANTSNVSETGQADGWGKPVAPQKDSSGESLKDDSWGKAAEKWGSGGDTSGSKAAWGQSGVSSGKQTDGGLDQPDSGAWGNAGGASSQVNVETGGWTTSTDKCDSQTKSWGTEKGVGDAIDNQTDSWNKPKSFGADSGPSWQKQESKSSWGKPEGTSTWSNQDGGSSWGKKDDGSSWNKNDGGLSSSGKPEGTSSWSKQDGGSSWGKKDDGSSWNKNDGGLSWNKPDSDASGKGESSWGKSAGKSSWGQQTDVSAEDKTKGWKAQNENSEGSGGDQGFGGWKRGGMGNRDDTYQETSWGRSKTFDAGRGSGGRRGRGWRGGRDNYGRGRSFDQGQSTSWNKEGQNSGLSDAGKTSSWSDQAGGWGNATSNGGSKKSGGWGNTNASGKDEESTWSLNANQVGERGHELVGANPNGDGESSGWNVPKSSNNSSGWGGSSNGNEDVGAGSNGLSSWDKETKPNENNKSSWNTATTSLDGNQSSGWSKEGNWGSQKASEGNSGWNQNSAGNGKDGSSSSWKDEKNGNDKPSWNTSTTSLDGNESSGLSKEGNWGSQKASEEKSGWDQISAGNGKDGSSSSWKNEKNGSDGSSTGWGQSNWGKSGTNEAGGNQESTWCSKSNWNTGSGFGGSNNQDDTSADGGRGGSWGGSRGGRGDRGGFRGRWGSDRGGFRGRGGSDRGGFGGRGGSGMGRFGGGDSDRGGYGGRGEGYRGRGGGFRGRGRGDWNNREDNSNVEKSYSWSKGSNNDGEGWKNSGSGGGWNQRDGDDNRSSSWSQPKETYQWGQHQSGNSSWHQPKGDASSGGWSKGNDSDKDAVGGGGWGSSSNASASEVSAAGWGKSSASKETSGWNNKSDLIQGTLSEQSKGSSEVEGAADAWGKAGNSNSSGNWKKPETTDGGQTTKDEGATSSWGSGSGSGKGGW